MNWKAFGAMMARDVHVAGRNIVTLLLQTMLQPLLFVFIFGQVMTRSGLMNAGYKSMLLPGIIAISMLMTGIQAVSMPLITELDRKSTRLNSSHTVISYAVFCLKKKKQDTIEDHQ